MKIAVITDTHFGVRNDAPIYNVISEKFYKDIFFKKIDELGIKTVIHLGDLYDRRKYVNFLTAQICQDQFISPLCDRGIVLHILRGNHDQYHKHSYEVNALKTLIAPLAFKYPIHIYDEATEVEFDGTKILFAPWVCGQNVEHTNKAIAKTKAQICFGHLELEGFEMFRGLIAAEGMSHKPFEKFEIVASGHYHHKSVKKNVHYLGAPLEFVWSDWNDPRGFHIFDTDTREFEFIQNPYTLFNIIQYDDVNNLEAIKTMEFTKYRDSYVKVVCTNKTDLYVFEQFMDKLYKSSPLDISIVEDASIFTDTNTDGTIDEAEDTMTLISNYVDGLTMPVDSGKMKTILKTIHNEAIALEMDIDN